MRAPPRAAFLLAAALAPWPVWSQNGRLSAPAKIPRLAAPPRALSVASLPAPSVIGRGPAFTAPASAIPGRAAPASALPFPLPAASGPAADDSAAQPSGAAEAALRGKTVVMVGTKASRPFIMREAARIASELGLSLVLVDDPANRAHSREFVPDSRFIASPINARDSGAIDAIAAAVAAHPEGAKAHAVVGFMSMYANLTGRITDRLGVRGISGAAVAAADDKPAARRKLNAVPGLEVDFREVADEAQARQAYREVSGGGKHRVILKTSRGEDSRFLAMSLQSEDAAAAAYLKMDAAVRDFVARPQARQTTFSSHPGIMMERMLEKLPGTEETSVEVVMQGGKAAFAVVSDTKGLGAKGKLAGGIMVFPSQQPAAEHAALIAASERALKALGLEDGNARLDMFSTPEGPRVIEINPFMGGAAIWQAVKSLTGMSLVEQGFRAVLGLPVDPGRAPDGVVHYIFLASSRDGAFDGVDGLDAAAELPGVEMTRVFASPGDRVVAAKGHAYEEWAEIIGKGRTWREAIDSALSAARRLFLRVKGADGTVVRSRGDHLQPTAADLAPVP